MVSQQNEPPEKEEKEPIKVSFSLPQLIGGALAAATAAAVGSSLGVAGTIFGAAVASVVGGVGGTLYSAGIDRTHRKVASVITRTGPVPVEPADGVDLTLLDVTAGAPPVAGSASGSASRSAGGDDPSGRKKRIWKVAAITAAAIFAIMLVGGQSDLTVQPNLGVWLASGALIGLGVIVPGMSPSNFLIYFGLYDKMASGIKNLDPGTIIPLAVGVVVCVVLLAKAVEWALHRSYSTVFHLILGMVIGSSVAIFPTVVFPAFSPDGLAASGLSLGGSIAFAVALLVAGTVASFLFSRVEDRYSAQRESIESSAKG